jgi:trehalose transport system permease protein
MSHLANYRLLLQDSQLALALRNTLWLTGLGASLQLLTGLGVAMVLHKLILGRGLVRTIVLTPLGVPTIVAGVMFTYLFGSAGYLNEILHRLGAIDTPIDWLAGDWRSLGVILTAELWKVTPLVTLIMLAGLESVPESAVEAVAVDGAEAWRRFWYVTLPRGRLDTRRLSLSGAGSGNRCPLRLARVLERVHLCAVLKPHGEHAAPAGLLLCHSRQLN